MNKEALRLIDRLYKDLYLDEQVLHHSSGNKYDKFNNIKEYLEKLENIHTKVSETGKHEELLKKLYYDKYVIKEENIPENYYKHQQQIALERGYGHVQLTQSQKEELQREIIDNQKRSLDTWLEYFLSEDAKIYPFWAKYWAFQGMLKLGTYDKEKGVFNKRDENTIAPFADLNREALAMSIDVIIKMINKEQIEDTELDILVKSGSFQKIYTYMLTKILSDNKNITKRNIGKWVKYNQGSDHMPLVESLQGYNTGWCTAGESTAKTQLSMGDFYVYYTLDENNEYKVPRIAIRMEYGKIAEIRGIAQSQNLEPEMEEIVEEKIKDFPDKEEYYKKVSDMKKLTTIYKKHQNKEELTKEELKFLYEVDDEIKGFGYSEDPRIKEIIKQRNSVKDLNIVFEDVNEYKNSLDLSHLESAEGLVLPENMEGSLILSSLKSAKGLVLPKKVGGTLDLSSLESAEGLKLPCIVGYNLRLDKLKSIKKVRMPLKIGHCLILGNVNNLKNIRLSYLSNTILSPELRKSNKYKLKRKLGFFIECFNDIVSEVFYR